MPLDLDLHMVIYSTVSSPDCQVFFNHKNCTDARLDVDNTEGGNNGPETITVSDYNPDQKYMIYVHEFNHDIQNTLGKSEEQRRKSKNNTGQKEKKRSE